MTITITGCEHTPEWETLQDAIRQATGKKGKLTGITRRDGKCDYRAPGTYGLHFTLADGNHIQIELQVNP